jgi:hypothetical protein
MLDEMLPANVGGMPVTFEEGRREQTIYNWRRQDQSIAVNAPA